MSTDEKNIKETFTSASWVITLWTHSVFNIADMPVFVWLLHKTVLRS